MVYHGKVIGSGGQVYYCEHNHRTGTAAVRCANSAATRQMAAIAWQRAAARAAQAAELARRREQERQAAEARRAAARAAETSRRAAAQVAAEEAKAAKRAAKLAAIKPERAWKRMTPAERLLRTADAELAAYGEIRSPDARAAYDQRAARLQPSQALRSPEPMSRSTEMRLATQPAVPAYLRALDPGLSPQERTLAKDEAARDPAEWQKYLAALQVQHEARTEHELAVPQARTETQNLRSPDMLAAGRTPAGASLARSPSGFDGDGLYVVGLDIEPGVYRTAGPARSERSGICLLLKSTSTSDIKDYVSVKGPATITIGAGIKAVQVRGCQPWQRLGDNLDDVLKAAASQRRNPAETG